MGYDVENGRMNMYGLLSRMLLIEADETLIKTILSDETMKEFFPLFVQWQESLALSHETLVQDHLNVDFASTFFIYLVPYESFYLRDDGMINSGGENPVISFYTSYGFEIDLPKARALSPDHIGIELEFMAKLVSEEKKAKERGDASYAHAILLVEKQFLEDHLLAWAPQLLLQVARHAQTPFYREAAQVALEMILGDYEYCLSRIHQG